ncbi:hypothetical protein [Bradyrhizobium sp. JYMT SZCCT0180]|uniref:hypothetical protein n=1 Tax=Bradyrhizobium sp. JYMT SZCCT0180 TaxID=2807666 RepID=UPI001BAC2A50|nr:hypothetical protein [Bradyrhizobium sp. JYMT SZCCT0180]MBR1209308.1 hypothetical protein [Bradyrhizobium sp. JYMT SZCCT0180]
MNDIDARCDSYLAWLDLKRREKAAVLAEIGAIRFAVDALTNPNITGVSGVGLAAISAAFGLANDSVKNFHSLLLQVDQTTVQSVVIPNRDLFRRDLVKFSSSIDNKPAAVHTLRTYLSICMPMTISANINSTVTVFKQTGMAPGSGPALPTLGVPLQPKQTLVNPGRPRYTEHPEFKAILDTYDPQAQGPEYVKGIQKALCVPKSEIGTMQFPSTVALIRVYEATMDNPVGVRPKAKNNGKLDSQEIGEILASRQCSQDGKGPRNFFELRTFRNNPTGKTALADLIASLNKVQGGTLKVTGDTLDSARARIREVRGLPSISKDLTLDMPDDLADQVTPDLYNALPN